MSGAPLGIKPSLGFVAAIPVLKNDFLRGACPRAKRPVWRARWLGFPVPDPLEVRELHVNRLNQ